MEMLDGSTVAYSLIHSGFFQAVSAFRKAISLKGRNVGFE